MFDLIQSFIRRLSEQGQKPSSESIEFEGEKEVLHGANDYMWFAYPDYDSNKYKVAQIVSIIRFIEKNCELGKGEELLILEKYD